MLSKQAAVDTARAIMNGPRSTERKRLNRIRCAVNPKPGETTVLMPDVVKEQIKALAAKARTNYLPLVVKNLRQTMILDGYRSDSGESDAWKHWQSNRMDARQAGLHDDVLTYGVGYVIVTPGRPVPVWRVWSPLNLTALYGDPVNDEWPVVALQVMVDGSIRLYDEEGVYFLAPEFRPPLVRNDPTLIPQGSLNFVEVSPHGLGVCPVVRFRDRWLTDPASPMGVVEPVLTIQERIDETVYGLLVAQYFQAFKQRYIIGWTAASEADELKARASEVMTFEDDSVKVGELAQATLDPYLNSKNSAVGDMATISQVPKQSLGQGDVANMSAEALAAMEAQRDREVAEIETSVGESHEQVFALSCQAAGLPVDVAARVRWRDATARSLAQTVDALVKLAQGLGVPAEALWDKIPGVADTDIAEWKRLAQRGDAVGQLTALIASQQGAGAGGKLILPPGVTGQ